MDISSQLTDELALRKIDSLTVLKCIYIWQVLYVHLCLPLSLRWSFRLFSKRARIHLKSKSPLTGQGYTYSHMYAQADTQKFKTPMWANSNSVEEEEDGGELLLILLLWQRWFSRSSRQMQSLFWDDRTEEKNQNPDSTLKPLGKEQTHQTQKDLAPDNLNYKFTSSTTSTLTPRWPTKSTELQ